MGSDDLEEEFYEELSDNKEDIQDEGDEFVVCDKHDNEEEDEVVDEEPTKEGKKTIWRCTAVVNHYKPALLTDLCCVGYLCSPNLVIIAHEYDLGHNHAENLLAIERLIEEVILPKTRPQESIRAAVLADLIDTFWNECEQFIKREVTALESSFGLPLPMAVHLFMTGTVDILSSSPGFLGR